MNVFKRLYLIGDLVRRNLWDTGAVQSIWKQRAVSSSGKQIPWFSYAAVDAIRNLHLNGARILELGSGGSTLFWHKLATEKQALKFNSWETDGKFYAQLCSLVGESYHAIVGCTELIHERNYLSRLLAACGYDVYVVDGPLVHREYELAACLHHICLNGGLVILDDSNWVPVSRVCANVDPHRLPVRVDYAGVSPAVSYVKVTSFITYDPYRWLTPKVGPECPVGGMPKYPGNF